MTVKCKNDQCNKVHSFRNHRGARLSDRRCSCGSPLELITYDYMNQERNIYKNRRGMPFKVDYENMVATPLPYEPPPEKLNTN